MHMTSSPVKSITPLQDNICPLQTRYNDTLLRHFPVPPNITEPVQQEQKPSPQKNDTVRPTQDQKQPIQEEQKPQAPPKEGNQSETRQEEQKTSTADHENVNQKEQKWTVFSSLHLPRIDLVRLSVPVGTLAIAIASRVTYNSIMQRRAYYKKLNDDLDAIINRKPLW
ncbi:hypothetical protein GUITHDRAFT_154697 [Guillardia theta CCMP2712]|uniref:Uncharacterized protein n=2 Tax=Guillardia theta TaxID=55529 RepID=L1IR78_GUITC|nr:hypothetical protein GUITHDRAFT_154697 [Guillardia theta CCMP2712]EKX38607.1 hypothetical protein GUITHDRAFT_154697 [Guillardia theta CCMP2712]|eukprot:XP_005825587.1 hypothetical protein GUITHDRAFT_154697 [Guillardia theta CCMP2712]